jgi:hypothetical protein
VLSREHRRQSGRIAWYAAGVVFVLVAGAIFFGGSAQAQAAVTYTTTCPTGDDACLALAERLESIDAAVRALPTADYSPSLSAIEASLAPPLSVTCDTTCASSATTATLSDEDHHRLDLTWWGVWALVGLGFVSLIAAAWFRAWNIEGKLGHG